MIATITGRGAFPLDMLRYDSFTVARWESFGCKCEVQDD